MRFTAVNQLTLAASASIGLIGGAIGGVIGTVDPDLGATPEQLTSCRCPLDLFKDSGIHINQDTTTYQCAYSNGVCTWNKLGALMNTKQTNCVQFALCFISLP